jgi:hypothetical protein
LGAVGAEVEFIARVWGDRRLIAAFLDESGTHAGSEVVLVGAVVTPDVATLESKIVTAAEDVYADTALWAQQGAQDTFLRRGFHFTEDSVAVRERFVSAIRVMDYRAHVAFSRHGSGVEGIALLVNMYYTLTRNLMLRYRTEQVLFVFEEESRMNSIYSKIVGAARDDIASAHGVRVDVTAQIGNKAAPAMGVVDYILAIAGNALSESSLEYQRTRFNHGLPAHLAHLVDFDHGVHRSARKGIELL